MAEQYDGGEFSDSESFWRFHVERQAQSGLSVACYCEAHGFSAGSLYNWRKKLASLGTNRRDAIPFIELTQLLPLPAAQSGEQADIELLVPGGLRLRLPRGFCPDTLRRALQVLASC